jgi:putative ABC transport system ATP-binding protein
VTADPPLELSDVTMVYGKPPSEVVAVDKISMQSQAGQILVILGPSGSGKTTLLSIAGCLMRPTEGSVRILGREVSKLNERQLPAVRRENVGFVFQTFNLIQPLSALENVLMPFNIAGRGGAQTRTRALALLDQLGLANRTSRHPSQLSAGEQQRVAIARALANKPAVLLADEPTANLDSATGKRVMTLLRRVIDDQEAQTLVVVTHDTRVLEFADRVLWMEDGHLSERPSDA